MKLINDLGVFFEKIIVTFLLILTIILAYIVEVIFSNAVVIFFLVFVYFFFKLVPVEYFMSFLDKTMSLFGNMIKYYENCYDKNLGYNNYCQTCIRN